MNHETIYLENSTILVDKEAEIKCNDYYFMWLKPSEKKYTVNICHDGLALNNLSSKEVMRRNPFTSYKILAANPKLGDLPLLPLPDEAEKLAKEIKSFESDDRLYTAYQDGLEDGFIKGYKAAKQDTFTKDDMIGFAEWSGKNYKWTDNNDEEYKSEELLQLYIDRNLKKQFVPEMMQVEDAFEKENSFKPKVINGIIQGTWE